MGEERKFIIQELNKEPFKKSFNLISFDCLDGLLLLQVLNDIIAAIDSAHRMDIREESPESTAMRMLEALRIFRYKPPTSSPDDLSNFRQALIQGDKSIIYPILAWLLQRIPELKKRAYLARFLVKIQVPSEVIVDEEVKGLYQQYEELIEKFKETHKELESLRHGGVSTVDIKKDISAMHDEKEQLVRRVERLRKRVESFPKSAPMLEVAKKLRIERDREIKLQKQVQELKNVISSLVKRIERVTQQLKDLQTSSIGQTPDTLLQKLEEETKVNQYLVSDKLPKQLNVLRDIVAKLSEVVAEAVITKNQLDEILNEIRAINTEINKLTEKKMMAGDPTVDKLYIFRQQAAIIQRKKEAAAEELNDVRHECQQAEQDLQNRQSELQAVHAAKCQGQGNTENFATSSSAPPTNLKGDEFKKYVVKLRLKNNEYKEKRQILNELRAELGALKRTEEVLSRTEHQQKEVLLAMESKRGVAGYHETQDSLEKVSEMMSQLNDRKGQKLEDMSKLIAKLNSTIASKKDELAPLIQLLRKERQVVQELQQRHDEMKQTYETAMAGYASRLAKLEQEVRVLNGECQVEESRHAYLKAMLAMLNQRLTQINEEIRCYITADGPEKKKCFRDLYNKKINEQDSLGRSLRESQRGQRETHGTNIRQMQLWKDLNMLLECKARYKHHREADGHHVGVKTLEKDRLTLF